MLTAKWNSCFFQFKRADMTMRYIQLTIMHYKSLYTNRQYTSYGMQYPKCYHSSRFACSNHIRQ